MSKYKDTKEEIQIISHKVNAIGIDWCRLAVYMDQSNKGNVNDKIENTAEVAIGAYLFAYQNPRIR